MVKDIQTVIHVEHSKSQTHHIWWVFVLANSARWQSYLRVIGGRRCDERAQVSKKNWISIIDLVEKE
jgi:hypothetical protein